MTAPPARNTLSGTPTNAQFNAGIGALYDYTVGLLGAAGTPAAARAALDAVGLTGDQTIGGVKTFTGNVGIGTASPGYRLDASAVGSVGAVIDIARFYADSGSTAEARILFGTAANVVNAGIGAVTTSAIDSELKFYTKGSGTLAERLRIDNRGTVTATGNITASGQFIGNGSVPPGAVMHFAMNSPPTGWLRANGAAVSRATFAALFAAIGTTYGAGDGSTTFNLPDLRGEFLRGWDDGRGVDTGRVFGSAQGDELRSHNHDVGLGSSLTEYRPQNSTFLGPGSTRTLNTGGAETRPRNVAMLACIKF